MVNIVQDLETSDPDDILTLILLLGNPNANLEAVTITPGTPEQIGLVRHLLTRFNRDIPVGVYNQPRKESRSCQ